jgi:hypothetical protein
MKCNKILSSICVIAMTFVVGRAAPPVHPDDATNSATKKAKKKTKDAGSSAVPTDSTVGATTSGAIGAAERAAPTITKNNVQTPSLSVSESEIAAARASGKVWVNTDTRVYHRGGRWYGATKHGKFMTEEEATTAGYRAAKTKK